MDNMPSASLDSELFVDDKIQVADIIVAAEIAKSKGEARRLIQQGGISVDDEKVTDGFATIAITAFDKGYVVIKKGKKVFVKVTL